jgi:hypothetical protein
VSIICRCEIHWKHFFDFENAFDPVTQKLALPAWETNMTTSVCNVPTNHYSHPHSQVHRKSCFSQDFPPCLSKNSGALSAWRGLVPAKEGRKKTTRVLLRRPCCIPLSLPHQSVWGTGSELGGGLRFFVFQLLLVPGELVGRGRSTWSSFLPAGSRANHLSSSENF